MKLQVRRKYPTLRDHNTVVLREYFILPLNFYHFHEYVIFFPLTDVILSQLYLVGFNTTIAKYENDDKDFNVTKLIGEVSSVAYHPVFNRPDSVLFINLGLHYTAGVKFADYKILISGLIDMFKHGYAGKVVWRTTTSLYKHKLWGKHEQSRRFLNHHVSNWVYLHRKRHSCWIWWLYYQYCGVIPLALWVLPP